MRRAHPPSSIFFSSTFGRFLLAAVRSLHYISILLLSLSSGVVFKLSIDALRPFAFTMAESKANKNAASASKLETATAKRTAIKRRLDTIDAMIKDVQAQIYEKETSYLESTQTYGNIVRGWDGYIDAKIKREKRKERKVKVEDRIFTSAAGNLASPTRQTTSSMPTLPSKRQKQRGNAPTATPATVPPRGVDNTTPEMSLPLPPPPPHAVLQS